MYVQVGASGSLAPRRNSYDPLTCTCSHIQTPVVHRCRLADSVPVLPPFQHLSTSVAGKKHGPSSSILQGKMNTTSWWVTLMRRSCEHACVGGREKVDLCSDALIVAC